MRKETPNLNVDILEKKGRGQGGLERRSRYFCTERKPTLSAVTPSVILSPQPDFVAQVAVLCLI